MLLHSVQRERRAATALTVVAVVAVSLTIALGAVLRLSDPLSSPVVPAEDPYTHMALVREHLRTGELSPLNTESQLYPPGLHAFLAAAWVYTGTDLYDLVLYGPAILGAIGILGMAVLLWRNAGPVAAFVGALAIAVAPEAIFRTTMMSPTALDLAVVPFFLYALLRILAGRLGWTAVAAPVAFFLALAHPWLLAILAAAGVAFLISVLLFPWPASRAQPLSTRGVAAALAVLGAALGVAVMMPTFGGSVNLPQGNLVLLGFAILAASLAPIVILLVSRKGRATIGLLSRAPPHLIVRLGLSAAIAATLIVTTFVAIQHGMPMHVDVPRAFGWPMLLLAFAALVALPFIASPIANLSAALFAATAPFVVFNPMQSEFLPHRTAIFLGIALAALAGVAAGALARRGGPLALAWLSHRPSRISSPTAATSTASPASAAPAASVPSTSSRRHARPLLLAAIPALVVAILLGGSIYTGTPDGYPGGWYRLYTPCELDALRDVADEANARPAAVIVTGDWQAKLVLAALTDDAERVWYKGDAFTSEEERGDLVATMGNNGRPVILVMDRYLNVETPDAETDFAQSAPWQPLGSWCSGMGFEQPRMTAYIANGGA